MMAQLTAPIRRLPGYLHRVRSDSLMRNSLYLMASTIVTAALGYVFWAVAAHAFPSQEVGIGGAIISMCSAAALLTYVGSSAMLIERLPENEHSSSWTSILLRICLVTAGVTAVATAIAVPVLMTSADYHSFFSSAGPVLLAVAGAAAWTLVNLLCAAFIAARRSGRFLSIQTLVSVTKVLLILPLAAIGAGAVGLVGAWVASAMLGICVGAVWLVPQMGLGRAAGLRPHRRSGESGRGAEDRARPERRGSHRRPAGRPSATFLRRLTGQHLTSVGGAVTPLLLPVLVVLRLGVTLNAYFYITWMLGGVFFMVSPAVSSAVFAEGVRARSDLRRVVAKALRVIVVMLAPPMVIMILGGRIILGLFGAAYAAAGYGLLVLLAISALPDAVSNVAVAISRVTHRLAFSTSLNLGILVTTLGGAWILMPRMGIAGAGVAWLGAQILGAIASLPAYALIRRPVTSSPLTSSNGDSAQIELDAGVAQLIDLARLQSLDRLSSLP